MTSIPASHLDLLAEANHAVLTTMMPDGTPQSSVVWADYDGKHVLICTTRERQKGRNMQANPNVALLVMDPEDDRRWLAIRGLVVDITEENAEAILDDLVRRYTGKLPYYGDIFPVEQREKETRVTVRIEPVEIEAGRPPADGASRKEDAIRRALRTDRTIDIITTGAKSGLQRRTEIWFTNVGGRIIICGTPDAKGGKGPRKPRDWLANLKAQPQFTFCLKESLRAELPARAVLIEDPQERRRLMSAPETKWYRDQVDSIDDLVSGSPIVEVLFDDDPGE
ncbi:MAG: TIGR03618 family F420-dependent PPOX class oxidoreductase [Anaerolineales bacterium]